MAVEAIVQDSETAAIGDSEWEYEYDENQTEECYLNIDLTTLQTEAALKAEQKRRVQKSTAKANASSVARDERATEVGSAESTPTPTPTANERPGAPNVKEPTVDRTSQLQVLDLHTENPFIKLHNSFYSCHWSTDLGTQFYVARPGVADEPLRPGHAVDVIGISRARVVGRPVTLRRRQREPVGASLGNAIAIDDDDQDVNIVADAHDVTIASPTRASQDPTVKAQASFLERLSAIKKRKGDTDTVPLEGVKQYRVPDNIDEIRERALAADRQRDIDAGLSISQLRKRGAYKRRPRRPSQSQSVARGGAKSSAEIRASLGLMDRNETNSAAQLPTMRSMGGQSNDAAQSISITGYEASSNQQSANAAAYARPTPEVRSALGRIGSMDVDPAPSPTQIQEAQPQEET